MSDQVESPVGSARRPRVWSLHPMLTVLIVALAVRAAAAAATHLFGLWPVAPDEQQYVDLARVVASGAPASDWDADWGHDLLVQTAAYLWPVILLFKLFGVHAFLAQVVSVVAGAITATATYRLAREVLPSGWALAAGLLVAVVPSQVLWSSLVLRESMVWMALALLALLCSVACRTRSTQHLLLLGAAAGACLFALGHLRPYVLVVAAWALVLAVLVAGRERRWLVPLGAGAWMLVIPLVTGSGIGGLSLVAKSVPVVGDIQRHLAIGADSAIVKPAPTAPPATAAHAPRAVPEADSGDARGGLSGVPRGLVAVALRPFAWEQSTGVGSRLAQLENLGWCLLYLLAGFGAWTARSLRRTVAFPVIFTVGFLLMSSLFEGNLGTAFRHRSQVLWALAVLAAIGAQRLWLRRSGAADTPPYPA